MTLNIIYTEQRKSIESLGRLKTQATYEGKPNQNNNWFLNGNFESQKGIEQLTPISKRPQMPMQNTVPTQQNYLQQLKEKIFPRSSQDKIIHIQGLERWLSS